MGLFQRSTQTTSNDTTADRFPEYVDALLSEAEDDKFEPVTPPKRPSYGIEKAIKLIRKLPDEKSLAMVAIVRDTLESADINVDSIVQDAKQRASEVEQRIATLSNEIEELQTLISKKQQEIAESEDTLDETHKVKSLLETAKSADSKSNSSSPVSTHSNEQPNLSDAVNPEPISNTMPIAEPIDRSA